MRIVKYGMKLSAVVAFVGIIVQRFSKKLAYLFYLFALFTLYFFRDPHRHIPADEELVVSPADGTVMEVIKVDEIPYFGEKGYRVSIFLSIFNVHINRAPIKGEVKYIRYTPGEFHAAFLSDKTVEKNENNLIAIKGDKIGAVVVQIAGLIARRIVCWTDTGKSVEKGDKIGMIRFGSRTDLYLPESVKITVKKGDKVKAGETIIGRIKLEKKDNK